MSKNILVISTSHCTEDERGRCNGVCHADLLL